jgi:hypothetical protein
MYWIVNFPAEQGEIKIVVEILQPTFPLTPSGNITICP